MKFGKRLRFLSVFVWSDNYIHYKGLKDLIRSVRDGKDTEESFISYYHQESTRINAFLSSKLTETCDRLSVLIQRTEDYTNSEVCNLSGLDSLFQALSAIQQRFNDLQDYVDVNRDGFRKAAKKFQRHVSPRKQTHTQTYLLTILLPRAASQLVDPKELMIAQAAVQRAFHRIQYSRDSVLRDLQAITNNNVASYGTSNHDVSSLTHSFTRSYLGSGSSSYSSLTARLREAIRLNDADRVSYLLRTSLSDQNIPGILALGGPLLHMCTAAGDVASSALLLRFGVDVNIRDVVDRTALQNSVRAGHKSVAEFLLSNGANIDTVSLNRHALLHSAVVAGNPECIKMLLEHQVQCRKFNKVSGNIFNGAPISDYQPSRETGRVTVNSNSLVKFDINQNMLDKLVAVDGHGFTPLFLASAHSHPKCLKVLLDAALQTISLGKDLQDKFSLVVPRGSNAPLSVATHNVPVTQITQLLSSVRGKSLQWTCLHAAAQSGAHKCVRILLETIGALSRAKDRDALKGLPHKKQKQVNFALPDNSSEITDDDPIAWVNARVGATSATALHEAAQRGFVRSVAWLLKAGACVTIGNAYGETPLHLAARSGHATTLALLLRFSPGWALAAVPPDTVPTVSLPKHRRIQVRTNGKNSNGNEPNLLDVLDADDRASWANLSDLDLDKSTWIPLLHEAIDSGVTGAARASMFRRNSQDSENVIASSSGAGALKCIRTLLAAGADPLEDDSDGWNALALALYIGNGQVAQLCRDFAAQMGNNLSSGAAGYCNAQFCVPPSDWRQRGNYVSQDEAHHMDVDTASNEASKDKPSPMSKASQTFGENDLLDDPEDAVEEGHETLQEGQWELRVTLGGIPSVRGTVAVPAVSFLPWALPSETAALVESHARLAARNAELRGNQDAQRTVPVSGDVDAMSAMSDTSKYVGMSRSRSSTQHTRLRMQHGQTSLRSSRKLDEEEYTTTKRVKLTVRRVPTAGQGLDNSGAILRGEATGPDSTLKSSNIPLFDASADERQLTMPLYYRKNPGPSARPLVKPRKSKSSKKVRREHKTNTNHKNQHMFDVGESGNDSQSTASDGSDSGHEEILEEASPLSMEDGQSDDVVVVDAGNDSDTSVDEGDDQPTGLPRSLETKSKGSSGAGSSQYAESVGSSASISSLLDSSTPKFDEEGFQCKRHGESVMCVGPDGLMVETSPQDTSDSGLVRSKSDGSEQQKHEHHTLKGSAMAAFATSAIRDAAHDNKLGVTQRVGVWETARPGELTTLAMDPDVEAEMVFHACSPFSFNLSFDCSILGAGPESVHGRVILPASMLTKCNPTSYTFHLGDEHGNANSFQPSQLFVSPEYGATAGHELDGYGVHRWGDDIPLRLSGQLSVPIISSQQSYSSETFGPWATGYGYSSQELAPLHPNLSSLPNSTQANLMSVFSRSSSFGLSEMNHLGILTIRYMFIRPYKPPVPIMVSLPKRDETPIMAKRKARRPYWKSLRKITGQPYEDVRVWGGNGSAAYSSEDTKVYKQAQLTMVPFVGGPTKVFGHRGSGADKASQLIGENPGARVRRTHVAENTLLSFVTAANLGAEYIEFDVQLSNDLVPVIHHDWQVLLPLAGRIKIPVTHLSAKQLQMITPVTEHEDVAIVHAPTRQVAVVKNTVNHRARRNSASSQTTNECSNNEDKFTDTRDRCQSAEKSHPSKQKIELTFNRERSMTATDTTNTRIDTKSDTPYEIDAAKSHHSTPGTTSSDPSHKKSLIGISPALAGLSSESAPSESPLPRSSTQVKIPLVRSLSAATVEGNESGLLHEKSADNTSTATRTSKFDDAAPKQSGANHTSFTQSSTPSGSQNLAPDVHAPRASRHTLHALGLDHTHAMHHREMSSRFYYGLRDSFTTLAKVFKSVPPHTGLNIEVKYPNPQQALEHGLRPVDKNTYVERILDCAFQYADPDRKIMFSSFDPDVCLMLTKKQNIYPVFLLTAAGVSLYADPRKNSLRAAVRFATRNGLLGIVSESAPLVEAPRLMSAVRGAGLVLCTYGDRNNEVDCVKVQVANGVAAVIVDHVAHVTRALREEAEA